MRHTKLRYLVIAFGGLLFAASCSKDELAVRNSTVGVTFSNPANLEDVKTSALTVTFKEVNSGTVSTFNVNSASELSSLNLPEGSYDVSLEGNIEYKLDETVYQSKIRGVKNGVKITGGNVNIDIPLFLYNVNAGLVLKEIFFTGTRTPENKLYHGDKYFIVYNNSEDTLYTDGLIYAEAQFLTITKYEYTPNVMAEAFTANNIVLFPGSGKEHRILPGEQVVVAANAIDNRELNPNSFDLRNANYELNLGGTIDVDNPQVPDLVNVNGAMIMHDRGFRSYVLARLPEGMTKENFMAENHYEYSYIGGTGKVMTNDGVKIPNTWILDAVNLSVASEFIWTLTAPALDISWTYCGKVNSDATRYGKSVRRKAVYTNPDGRVILLDNNDSANDFEAEAKPSLMP